MEYRTLDLNVISAEDLKNVRHCADMRVYVVVFLQGVSCGPQPFETPIDRDSGCNPVWKFPLGFCVDEPSVQQNRVNLHFVICCDRTLGDKLVGKVVVPVKVLLDSSPASDGEATMVTYKVRGRSGQTKGELHFSYKFSDKLTAAAHPPHGQQQQQPPGRGFVRRLLDCVRTTSTVLDLAFDAFDAFDADFDA